MTISDLAFIHKDRRLLGEVHLGELLLLGCRTDIDVRITLTNAVYGDELQHCVGAEEMLFDHLRINAGIEVGDVFTDGAIVAQRLGPFAEHRVIGFRFWRVVGPLP